MIGEWIFNTSWLLVLAVFVISVLVLHYGGHNFLRRFVVQHKVYETDVLVYQKNKETKATYTESPSLYQFEGDSTLKTDSTVESNPEITSDIKYFSIQCKDSGLSVKSTVEMDRETVCDDTENDLMVSQLALDESSKSTDLSENSSSFTDLSGETSSIELNKYTEYIESVCQQFVKNHVENKDIQISCEKNDEMILSEENVSYNCETDVIGLLNLQQSSTDVSINDEECNIIANVVEEISKVAYSDRSNRSSTTSLSDSVSSGTKSIEAVSKQVQPEPCTALPNKNGSGDGRCTYDENYEELLETPKGKMKNYIPCTHAEFDLNSSTSQYTESLPSTIYSDDIDVEFMEDFSDIDFSMGPDHLNDAFIEE
ncbi:uncharacterized protein LOC126844628 [Adelges cooleyi]|uniref:uncharacterized protein LOC126844628 n=1 Tax=Adelges cooleyi TaxID=133065 RepID=UPI00217F4F80|nr:uncharacterized protein LOC126844628 [Adelges cooleyi]